eukprot:scaffold518_cov388-Prasinococcus_capsulatus_cf.AAC.74
MSCARTGGGEQTGKGEEGMALGEAGASRDTESGWQKDGRLLGILQGPRLGGAEITLGRAAA